MGAPFSFQYRKSLCNDSGSPLSLELVLMGKSLYTPPIALHNFVPHRPWANPQRTAIRKRAIDHHLLQSLTVRSRTDKLILISLEMRISPRFYRLI